MVMAVYDSHMGGDPNHLLTGMILQVPSRKLTYPTLGKEKSSSNMPYQGDMLIHGGVWVSLKRQELFFLGSRHHDGEFCCRTVGESNQICRYALQ